jgi:hypothetical protein
MSKLGIFLLVTLPMEVKVTNMGPELQSQNPMTYVTEKLLDWDWTLQKHFGKAIFHCV